MNKHLYFLMTAIFIVLCTGCSTNKNPGEQIVKLDTAEYNQLAAAATNALLGMPDSKISKGEKKYIEEHAPNFRVLYTGNKKGKYAFAWEIFTGKTIQVFGKGNMLDFRDSFEKVSIVSVKINKPKNDS